MRSSLQRAAALLATLAVTALVWMLRPPLHDIAFAARQLTAHGAPLLGYALVWLLAATACTTRVFRLSQRARQSSLPSTSWLPPKPTRRPASPLALGGGHPLFAIAATPCAEAKRRDQALDEPIAALQAEVTPAMESKPAISLLGPITITRGRTSRQGLRAVALELVAYLALHPHGATRDELLEAIWPDQDPLKTRGRLYQATRDARRLLGHDAIVRTRERYRLDRTLVDVDADHLDEALRAAEHAPDQVARRTKLEQALALFSGQPLDGVDNRWSEAHANRLRSVYVELVAATGRARLESGDSGGALEAAERGLEVEPLNEDLWRLALTAEGAAGLRGAVEARYQTLQTVLNERLGLKPASETRALYRRLLAQA
jgi:DNA-binding SARP family transcriptional activator